MFALNPDLDVEALARRFAIGRRLSIPDFLAGDAAMTLHRHLRAREDWRQVLNSGEKLFELDRATRAAMSPEQGQQLDAAVFKGAREGFQYRYETIRVPDDGAARRAIDDPINAFAAWLSEGETRYILRHITGADDVAFADAQATAYAPGDFLTGHDDDFAGKSRRAAYVFGLTPVWRIEWGGLLLFHDQEGRAVQGLPPMFNTLNLFAVPQLHSVSMVTPAAAHRRYAITGWLRAR